MSESRDTQFQGFAKLLLEELKPDLVLLFVELGTRNNQLAIASAESIIQSIIARRASDLVKHTLWHSTPASGSTIKKYRGMTIGEITDAIPDLTEWPKAGES